VGKGAIAKILENKITFKASHGFHCSLLAMDSKVFFVEHVNRQNACNLLVKGHKLSSKNELTRMGHKKVKLAASLQKTQLKLNCKGSSSKKPMARQSLREVSQFVD
jgi:hypothetical protein